MYAGGGDGWLVEAEGAFDGTEEGADRLKPLGFPMEKWGVNMCKNRIADACIELGPCHCDTEENAWL